MKQASLFENSAPLAAHSDPITSHMAAQEVTDSGARDAQKRSVLASLRREIAPPTSRELAISAKLDRYLVARRLPDLESDGKVRKAGMRMCSISNRMCVTWAIMRSA